MTKEISSFISKHRNKEMNDFMAEDETSPKSAWSVVKRLHADKVNIFATSLQCSPTPSPEDLVETYANIT
ncbi:hypothetical protein TSAR_001167 [Trichomalopsis sarcophagae]|uniref:Uncharacterized protein n=1 Tax=Trichomalopsis sarcophagae TaxID=543379 RepID=A0A232EPS7_9HYME|nr:hypothetical protein TSAR_001167 [Trichomalopsis sarcophagae]